MVTIYIRLPVDQIIPVGTHLLVGGLEDESRDLPTTVVLNVCP